MTHNVYLYIFIMAAVSFAIRSLPMTLIRKPIRSQFVQSFLYYVPSPAPRPVPQQAPATAIRLAPHQAAMSPTTRAAAPEMGLWVASTMAGKVITDRVT